VQEAAKIPIANANQTEQEREKGRGEGRNCVMRKDCEIKWSVFAVLEQ
jgi:hypothetical protein